ncbi:ubiquitin-conjugating enzyme (huntingtin interacting protein 2) [Babesia microti strain RI]|uniref:E2 ubiquitin-conjugating enzyme n=1 Tax=Babesia microti (strain RI) TaxID=1133968 RepID=A0A1R4AC32_BABMR|nr:ubiquitin-conjugating enzyme (huntingtin interacting protein 2) [Babesia microti strain RI]SJK86579.1 ubiquitin-conjugating enzyme (huntingtin interacting protein 2) [Babesia microti strain RI]|eukprot:XP_021338719.1 ubiquitin-conjugating enzyme (huntingtin interacting protein 2) [Babesia microti strain RI]
MSSACGSTREHIRLQRELQDIKKAIIDNVSAYVVDGDIYHWIGYIKGPIGTVYEEGHFNLDIHIPEDYPYNPPKIKFLTKIWHPNISSETGAICLDILKNEWSPALTIRTVLISIQALLSAPEPDDPQDAEVAKMYLRDIKEFENTARLWVKTFARKNDEQHDDKINKIVEIGFTREQAEKALSVNNWDETIALNYLLEST